jgi:hypothetical protein
MPPVGVEPTIPVSERPQTHALDRAATGIGMDVVTKTKSSALQEAPSSRPALAGRSAD